MTTNTQNLATQVTLTVSGLSTLAAATYAVSSAVDLSSSKPFGLAIAVSVTPGSAPSGNKVIKVFAKVSLDNTLFTSGPETGTTTTDENQLRFLGVVRVTTSGQAGVEHFELSANYEFQPYFLKLVFFNDAGVALSAAAVTYREVGSQNA